MAYSSYGSQISSNLTPLNSFYTDVTTIDLASIWQGSAYSKQSSNLSTLTSALSAQVAQLSDMVDVLVKIDEYDQLVKDIEKYNAERNALDTNATDYVVQYESLTNLIDTATASKDKLKYTINNVLNNTTRKYTKYYNEIPKTDVVGTLGLLDDAAQYFSKIDNGFDMSNSIVPFWYGVINKDNSNPNFNNSDAWVRKNPYAGRNTGQCTWFAWGRFYEIYGYSPGFTTNGNGCVNQLLKAHGDKFVKSNVPVAGAVFSTGLGEQYGHVGIVLEVDEANDRIVIQDGNQNGQSDSFAEAQKDWRTKEYSLSEFCRMRGGTIFANPIGREAVMNG